MTGFLSCHGLAGYRLSPVWLAASYALRTSEGQWFLIFEKREDRSIQMQQVVDQAHNKTVIIIGTLDTKGPEVFFLRDQLQQLDCKTRVVDVGLAGSAEYHGDIRREEVAARAGSDINALLKMDEGKINAMEAMARGAVSLMEDWIATGEIAGAMALGGGLGTWVGIKIMRTLPAGFPKIMISTLPFDIRSHLNASDIVIFPSVADILGLNPMLRKILRNAAGAMAGMVTLPEMSVSTKKVVGITSLGVTTPLAMASRKILERHGFEVAGFHATGLGGSAFEEWIGMGMFAGVLDLSPHELTSLIFKGVAMPRPDRMETAAIRGIPQVVVPGGLDFISRGPVETLSEAERRKPHYRHSPMFTHVRVSREQMREVARVVAQKLNRGKGPAAVVVPLRGFSDQSRPGGPISDPASDKEFVRTLRQNIAKRIRIVEVDAHINDEVFARAVCSSFFELLGED